MPMGSGSALPGQGDFLPAYPAHAIPETDGVGMSGPEYGFQQTPTDSQRSWEQMGNLSSPNAPMNRARDSMQPQYWRSGSTGSGPPADFAPFPTTGIPPDPAYSYPMPNAQSWHPSQSARSASYGHMQDAGAPGYIPSAVGYAPQPAQEVQPTGATTFPSVDANRLPTAQEPHSASHGMGYPQPSPFMFQSQGAVSVSPIPGQVPFANHWYGENSHYGTSDHDLRSPTDQRSFTTKPS